MDTVIIFRKRIEQGLQHLVERLKAPELIARNQPMIFPERAFAVLIVCRVHRALVAVKRWQRFPRCTPEVKERP